MATREPFPPEQFLFRKVRQEALNQGLICWPGVGSAATGGDFILLAPPYIISDTEMGSWWNCFPELWIAYFSRANPASEILSLAPVPLPDV